MPEVLYEEVVEVEERVVLQQDTCQLNLPTPLIEGSTGEKVHTNLVSNLLLVARLTYQVLHTIEKEATGSKTIQL